jgi:hypothetical protein
LPSCRTCCGANALNLRGAVSLILFLRRVAFQPSVYHGARLQFCFLAWSADDLPLHLDARRMNGDGPLLSLDPSADGVSYAPVLHRVKFGPKSAVWAMRSGARRGAADRCEHRQAANVAQTQGRLLRALFDCQTELDRPHRAAHLLGDAADSCPIGVGPSIGCNPRYGHRSDPHTQVTAMLMTASVGSTIVGVSRSSK